MTNSSKKLKTNLVEKEEKQRHIASKTKKHRVAKQNEHEADKELLEWKKVISKPNLQKISFD